MGLDFGLGGNRWQGYSHEELYAMLHAGPGPSAAGVTADRWSAMAGALSDIQQDISSGVASSGASWVGDAGDVARAALNPLGDWAQQASDAAVVMRQSTEIQGDLLSKARAEMPAPVPIPQQTSQLSQLVTAQVDYEVAEAASQVAAQQAFQVMAQYEAGTTDNTSTLGEFDQPPALRVDTTPITGVAVHGRIGRTESPRRVPRTTSTRSGAPVEESVGRSPKATATTAPTEETTPPPAIEEPTEPTPGVSSVEPPPTPESVTPAPTGTESPTPTTSSAADPAPAPSTSTSTSTAPSSAGSTTPSSAAPATESPTEAGQLTTPATSNRNRDDNGTTSTPTPRAATGTFVPAARRANRDDEPDEEHESKYLILADDIYGDQAYSPPVIGEHRPRR